MNDITSIELPKFTEEYKKQIENSWLEHFSKKETETKSYFEFLLQKHLKELLDKLIIDLPLHVIKNKNKFKIHCHVLVFKVIENDINDFKYQGFKIKFSDILPSPFFMFVSAIE